MEKEKIPLERGTCSVQDIVCLLIKLEDIKRRIVEFDQKMKYFSKEYKKKLAEVDRDALDNTIKILKCLV